MEIKRAKGTPQEQLEDFGSNEYEQCIDLNVTKSVNYNKITQEDFTLTTRKQGKIALSSITTKRFWMCSERSLPLGSSLIKIGKFECIFCRREFKEEQLRKKRKAEWLKSCEKNAKHQKCN